MPARSVTFETKCWERDWKILLTAGRLERMIDACNYAFAEKVLYINNVCDRKRVFRHADKLVSRNVITRYCCVEEYAQKPLSHFQIEKESFKGGIIIQSRNWSAFIGAQPITCSIFRAIQWSRTKRRG